MLSLIRVKNYAVIDEVEVEFEPGLSVMTGETGAGKSILVDALGLVLGDRADASTVRQGAERADVSAVFETPADHPALAWLREHSLDEDNSCLIRRVIGSEGRSRAFINGQPVTLQDLRSLGNLLLNIHGQHAHQALREGAVQRQMLDFHGDHEALVADVAEKFDHWRTLRERLEASTQNSEDREAQLELLRFQLDELERLDLQKTSWPRCSQNAAGLPTPIELRLASMPRSRNSTRPRCIRPTNSLQMRGASCSNLQT